MLFLLTMGLSSLGSQQLPSSRPLRHAVGITALTWGSAPCCSILACHWKSFSGGKRTGPWTHLMLLSSRKVSVSDQCFALSHFLWPSQYFGRSTEKSPLQLPQGSGPPARSSSPSFLPSLEVLLLYRSFYISLNIFIFQVIQIILWKCYLVRSL